MSEYTIRQFRSDDVDDFLELYSTVFGELDHAREWFSWKYRANPYVDHVPILVAESDGNVVGARPFFALRMTVGGRRCLALQPCDTMVHPDHRRNKLFTRMTERAIDRYDRGRPAFFFNFPNDNSLPGYLKLGWQRAGTVARCYRFQNLAPFLRSRSDTPGSHLAGRAGTPLLKGYNALRELTASSPSTDPIRREDTVPATELAAIYRERVPDGIHAVRDERFYEWRFDTPKTEYTTYLTESPSDPVGLVVGQPVGQNEAETTITRIVDVVPFECNERSEQVSALLDHVLADTADSDLLVTQSSMFPRDILRRRGFHSEDSPPLSYIREGRRRVVRSLSDLDSSDRDIRAQDNWSSTFAEMDAR